MTYFHEEQRFGRWVYALVVTVAVVSFGSLIVTVGAIAAAHPEVFIGPAIIILVFVLLALARLDVDVDDRGIHIAFHLLWPTRNIPLEDIRRAHATTYTPLAWGGYGVHYMLMRGWAYNASGTAGVLVETDNGNVMIGSQRANELEAAIARAIADRGR